MWTVEPLHFDATLTPASQDAGVTAPAQLLSISSVKNVDFLLSLNSITPENSNLVKLDLDLDPDPHSEKRLDPDPHKMNADPQPCLIPLKV